MIIYRRSVEDVFETEGLKEISIEGVSCLAKLLSTLSLSLIDPLA